MIYYTQFLSLSQERASIQLTRKYPDSYEVRVILPFQPPFLGELKADGDGKLVTTRKFLLTHRKVTRSNLADPQIVLPLNQWGISPARRFEESLRRKCQMAQRLATQSPLSGDAA